MTRYRNQIVAGIVNVKVGPMARNALDPDILSNDSR